MHPLRNQIDELLKHGLSYKQVSSKLGGVNLSTIHYRAKKIGVAPGGPGRRHDHTAIAKFYRDGATFRECVEVFGCSLQTVARAIRKSGDDARRPGGRPPCSAAEAIERWQGSRHSSVREFIRAKIIGEKLIPYICAICGIDKWRGEPIVLRLDHINGDGGNHDLTNLRFLCPNCDSQQDTYCHKNRNRYAVVAQLEAGGSLKTSSSESSNLSHGTSSMA